MVKILANVTKSVLVLYLVSIKLAGERRLAEKYSFTLLIILILKGRFGV
jgi:hypothetical protein